MNDSLVFLIGLGLGLGVAAGLRPFLPALLAGGLASGNALGLNFAPGGYSFLEEGWWLIAVAAFLVIAYAVQLRVGSERLDSTPFAAALAGVAVGVGAVLFAGTLSVHGDIPWPGLIGGALAAALSQAAVRPVVVRARRRLPDRSSKEALSIYLDGASLLVAALVCLLHPLGYVALALFGWLMLAGRRRDGSRYAGLRILRG